MILVACLGNYHGSVAVLIAYVCFIHRASFCFSYDFAIMYASHPRCCLNPQELSRRAQELFNGPGDLLPKSIIDQLLPQIEIADISLTSHDWSRLVVAKPSPWIDPDSDDPYLRRISEEVKPRLIPYSKS